MKQLVKFFLLLLLPTFARAQSAESTKHLEKLKAELANTKADTNRLLLIAEICTVYQWVDKDSLDFYGTQGLDLAKKLNFHRGGVRILNSQGIFLAFHGNSPKALALLYKALRIAEENKLTFETANCLNSIGASYWFLNDFTKAHEFINRAVKLDETVQHTPNDIYWRILIQIWSGRDCIQLNKLDSAIIILKKAYDNAFNPAFTDFLGCRPTILMFSGVAQSKLGNKDAALKYLRQSIEVSILRSESIGVSDACNYIAEVFKDLNQRDSVIYYSKLGLDFAQKTDLKPAILLSSKMLAEQYETTDTKQANKYWKMALAVNDSLYGTQKVQELQKTLFEEQRRQQLEQELQTKRENQLKQYGFGLGLGVLSLVGLFLYRNNRQKQKANTKLQNTLGELQTVQTELEIKSREAQIELSLEKVRSRSMAMHQSNELAAAASVLFQQIKDLGFEMWSCGFCIWKPNNFSELWMSADSGGLLPPMMMPYKEEPTHHKIYEHLLLGQPTHQYVWEGEELLKHYEFLYTIPSVKEAIDILKKSGLSLPLRQCYYVGYFKQGYLLIITKEPNTEMNNLSYRFTKVFEQTYTRFLDLQKAEAQAREAEIELALERVRSRTMAMQHSDELGETANLLFQQVQALSIPAWSCGFNIWEKNETNCIGWMSSNGILQPPFRIPLTESPSFIRQYESKQKGEIFYVEEVSGEALAAHYRYMNSLPDFAEILKDFIKRGYTLPTFQINHTANFKHGSLIFITSEPVPEAWDIFIRLTKVFEQTYTRFLDLQKAEALAEQSRLNLIQIQTEKKRAEEALKILKATQNQLIQSEKLASLGELTAGIAHEIQNPLNFVNNFSELSVDLVKEVNEEIDKPAIDKIYVKELMHDLTHNQEKINLHGKRASSIVKGMLEHSRASTGVKELTDINKLCDEYFRLAYHGLRAKDKEFNCELITHFDETLPKIDIIPQDVGRVVLNLINNAFYAVNERKNSSNLNNSNLIGASHLTGLEDKKYKPVVTVITKKTDNAIEISVKDNGIGMSENVKAKVFQPFFTTKPTGSGTGLGLSLAYDIITKGHSGKLTVESTLDEGSTFIIQLPT